tara:strand:- start:5301 stop:5975 length:675 start_codon:yes stop_codon:yes gene_type:complete
MPSNEFRHEDIGAQLSRAEWEGITTHRFDSQATGDILYASSATQLSRLSIGAANKVLISSGGIPAWDDAPSSNVSKDLFIGVPYSIGAGTVTFRGYHVVINVGANDDLNVYYSYKVPDDFVSFGSLSVVWMSPAASGDARLYLATQWAASGESYSNSSEVDSYAQFATSGANLFNVTDKGTAYSGLAKGDYVGVRIIRQGSSASDTLNSTFYLSGLLFSYTGVQ